METLLIKNNPSGHAKKVSLHDLVSGQAKAALPVAVRNGSYHVNDVPRELFVHEHAGHIAAVLGKLFSTVAKHSSGSCIRVSAKVYGNVTLLHLRDSNSPNSYTIAHDLLPAQPIAERIGGYLGITSRRKNETTIVFSFPNQLGAALNPAN